MKEIENLKKMAKEAMGAVFSTVSDSVSISSQCVLWVGDVMYLRSIVIEELTC